MNLSITRLRRLETSRSCSHPKEPRLILTKGQLNHQRYKHVVEYFWYINISAIQRMEDSCSQDVPPSGHVRHETWIDRKKQVKNLRTSSDMHDKSSRKPPYIWFFKLNRMLYY